MKKKFNKRQNMLLEIIEELRNEVNNKNHVIEGYRKENFEYAQRCTELEEENCKLKKQLSDLVRKSAATKSNVISQRNN